MPNPSVDMPNIAKNLLQIQKKIIDTCHKYHRPPLDVHLLAVSKTKPAEYIKAAFSAGQSRFGENYLQEALNKIKELSELAIEWHFIGAIQSNKTRELAEHFNWVHSVDRLKIAHRLSQQRPASLPLLNICLQVNISNEASKAGFNADEIDTVVNEIASLPGICLRGLMAIPAKTDDLNEQRKAFAKMKTMLSTLQKKHPQMDTLSMGMSGDMEAAIAEGTTLLRIGTAIFGARNRTGV